MAAMAAMAAMVAAALLDRWPTWAEIRTFIEELAKEPFDIVQWIQSKGPQEFCQSHAAVDPKFPPPRKTYPVGRDQMPFSLESTGRLEDIIITGRKPENMEDVFLDDYSAELVIKLLIGDPLSKQSKAVFISLNAVQKLKDLYEKPATDCVDQSERAWKKTPVTSETVSNSPL